MITPSFALTATERVLPKLALDFTTASLDPRVTFTRAGNTATVVNSSGFVAGINADLPRFDYTPTTLACKGLLIEEARTNVLTYSSQFDNVIWTKSGTNTTGTPPYIDVAVSPDNTQNADKLIENTGTSVHIFFQTFVAATGSTTYTWSTFVKAAERTFFMLESSKAGMTTFQSVFNLTTGALVSTSATSATITPYQNGWYRVTHTFTTDAAPAGLNCVLKLHNGSTGFYTGDGTSGAFIWGAQLETGAFATSYIPTVASQVTRTADVATMTGTNFSDWFNAIEGTFEVTAFSFASDSTQRRAITANDTTNQNIIDISRIGSTAQSRAVVTTVGVTVFNSLNAAWSLSTAANVVTSYKQNDFAACLGGGTLRTDNAGDVPVVTQLQIGNLLSIQFWCGHIQKIMYWPQRLTNNEVQAFSK